MLNLDGVVMQSFTRREWVVIITALSYLGEESIPGAMLTIADDLTQRLQSDGTTPVGVIARAMVEFKE